MKKILFAIALVMTMSFCANAQDGFFQGGEDNNRGIGGTGTDMPGIGLPNGGSHNAEGDQSAPLGSGLLILTAMGAGYALRKRNK